VWPHDSAQPRNDIELLAFLKQPGELEVEIGKHVYRSKASSGMTSFRVPLVPGNPIFRLWRGGKIAVETRSPHTITREVTYQNLLYHGGSSTRRQSSPLESK